MRLRLSLSLRRALMAAMVCMTAWSGTAQAGLSDARYDLQYYLDFAYNQGMFAAGATNITIYYKDGSSVSNPTIPLMPNLDSFGSKGAYVAGIGFMASGGSGLVAPQYLVSADHCHETDVYFLTQGGNYTVGYSSTGYAGVAGLNTNDWSIQRLNKIVTEVAYTPYASNEFMAGLVANSTWLYRAGDGSYQDTNGGVNTNGNAMGGICNIDSITQKSTGTWVITAVIRENDTAGDTRPPMEISVTSGDSGSPVYAWDAENNRFVHVAFASCSGKFNGYDSNGFFAHNPTAYDNFINSYDVAVSDFSGTQTILWGTQDAVSGQGTLQQGEVTVTYTGKGSANSLYDTLGLVFSTADTVNTQELALQGSVNMGAGALTFDRGSWKLTEADAASTFNSAGFVVNAGAELTVELTGTASEEWRKVGEGTMTISGAGNNEATLRVGGGTTQYLVTYDAEGNITGCTLGNVGETRLDRDGGYAAGSIRLEAGVAIIVLMQDGQIKTNSVAGDSFSFGNAGGLLNMNGHDLTWGVINQDGSGTGARIGNMTPLGESAPGLATFTFTGSGQFAGCFVDEGRSSTAQLAVVYDNADSGSWVLTGQHSNVGGFTVENGTMVLQGKLTPHTGMTDAGDWTYAMLEGSDVTVRSGAVFQLADHALMCGNVNVEAGGTFIMNQTVNAAVESIGGGYRQNMADLGLTALRGNVSLSGNATMIADVESPVSTVLSGSVLGESSSIFTKRGSGVLEVTGKLSVGSGTVAAGGLVVHDREGVCSVWQVAEQGFISVLGMSGDEMLTLVSADSSGVLALNADQSEQVNMGGHSAMYVGAWGTVNYGSAGAVLNTVQDAQLGSVWRLGGGTGTLNVLFKLTGEADLIIGNEWSSGTVHLANTANDFAGDILIQGTGNKLTYANGALGNARVALSYGNALGLYEPDFLGVIKAGSDGVLATATSADLDLRGTVLSLGADGAYTYTGKLAVDDTYRFGGSGQLTLDTALDGADSMRIDGQGTTGSSVTFTRENAFTGSIVAGGGLELAEPNSTGEVAIHVGHASALAAAASVELQKGAVLYTDGGHLVVQNLSAGTGASIRNNGDSASLLLLQVTDGVQTSIADGVLADENNAQGVHLVKAGSGTLTMGVNASWSGGMTISQGTVVATLTGAKYEAAAGGIGSVAAGIYLESGATLRLNMGRVADEAMGCTLLPQTLTGTGTVVLASGGNAMFSEQSTAFNGSVRLEDNTRLYIGKFKFDNGYELYDNLTALSGATVVVESGSQAKVTNALKFGSLAAIRTTANFVISGNGYAGVYDAQLYASALCEGALAIDNLSTVYGNITLADDAMITSSSTGSLSYLQAGGSTYIYGDAASAPAGYATYGVKNYLGGIIRGLILGEGKTLTFGGNEGMTITADSANTFGNLVIASGNGHNDEQFALRLDNGKAVSRTSTALGTGEVLLSAGLILRLAGTGVANQADVVYTYENAMTVGDASTIQSYNITNVLSGVVSMSGSSLNLATAQGGVLELTGGIDGNGTLNLAAGSTVVLGSASAGQAGTAPVFSGTVVAGAAVDLIFANASVVAADTVISGTDSLALGFGGTAVHSLGSITVADAAGTGSTLSLSFDFTESTAQNYTALSLGNLTAGTTSVSLQLNMFEDIEEGVYTLLSGDSLASDFTLADDFGGRLSLSASGGELILTVGADTRLYWSADGESQEWSAGAANWQLKGDSACVGYSAGASVVLDASGVATGNSATAREVLSLGADQSVSTLAVKDAAYAITGDYSLSGNSLAVGLGGDLLLDADATFTQGTQVNNGSLTVDSATLEADVTLENGATFTLQNGAVLTGGVNVADSSAAIDQASYSGAVNLGENATLSLHQASVNGTLSSQHGSINLSFATLTGSLSVAQGGEALYMESLDISGGSVVSSAVLSAGTITLTDGSLQLNAACAVESLRVAAGKTVTLWNESATAGADKLISKVELGDGAVLQTNDRAEVAAATRLGSVQLNGASATLQDVHHSGAIAVDSLLLGEGVGSATLTLAKNAASTKSTIFELGAAGVDGGNFAGTIELQELNTGSKRSAFIILNNAGIAANAVISLAGSASADAHIGLGIKTDASIAGLSSAMDDGSQAKLFSGTVNTQTAWNTGDTAAPATVGDALRTLTINTAAGESYTFYGEVLGNLNLVKSGEGTQTFSGSSAGFNGNIAVQGGVLAFGENALSMLSSASSVTVGAGTLDISAMDFSTQSITVATGQTFSFGADALLDLGALAADTQYGVFTVDGGTLDGWVGLDVRNFIIDGESLGAKGRVELSLGMDGSFSYSMADNITLYWDGNESGTWNFTDAEWDATAADGNPANNETFCTGDSVVFSTDAVVTVEDGISAGALQVDSGVSLTTLGGVSVGSLSMGEGAVWTLASGTQQSLTESLLKGISSASLVVEQGARLTVTDMTAQDGKYSSVLDAVSGAGDVVLNYAVSGNGSAFDFRGLSGTVQVDSGRVLINESKFDADSQPVLKLMSENSQLVFNGPGTELRSNVVLAASTTIHTNSGKSGVISGVISGEGALTKAGAGTLTFASQNTYTGATSIADGKIILNTGSDYTLLNTVSGGTLEVVAGTTLKSNGKNISSKLVLNGGDALIMGNNNRSLKGNVEVHAGSTLSFAGTGSDMLDYNASGKSITVNGGTLDFGSTRQTMGSWGLTLANGALVSGSGGVYSAAGGQYYAAMDFNKDATIAVTSGDNTISAVTRLRGGDARTLTYDVAEDASLHVSGKIMVDSASPAGKIVKTGAGELNVSTQLSVNKLDVQGGALDLYNQTEPMSLEELKVAAGVEVSAYTGAVAEAQYEALIAVNTLAQFGKDVTINADFMLTNGASLSMDGSVRLDSNITLMGNHALSGEVLTLLQNSTRGETIVLFTGVDSLFLGTEEIATDITLQDSMLASGCFSNVLNIDDREYYLTYTGAGTGEGVLAIAMIPEPSSATLSLLALAALAMRRRRK